MSDPIEPTQDQRDLMSAIGLPLDDTVGRPSDHTDYEIEELHRRLEDAIYQTFLGWTIPATTQAGRAAAKRAATAVLPLVADFNAYVDLTAQYRTLADDTREWGHHDTCALNLSPDNECNCPMRLVDSSTSADVGKYLDVPERETNDQQG